MSSTSSSPVDCLQSISISFLSSNDTFLARHTAAIHAGGGRSGRPNDALHNLLNRIRRKKEILDEWKNGLLVKLPKKRDRPLKEGDRGDHVAVTAKRTVLYRQYKVWIRLMIDEQADSRQEHSSMYSLNTISIR